MRFAGAPIARIALIGAFALVFLWSLRATEADPGQLVSGAPAVWNLLTRLYPPRFEIAPQLTYLRVGALTVGPFGLPATLPALLETIQMALVGTVGALFISLPIAFIAARNTAPHPIFYYATRALLNVNRATPELIFALIFVAAVGLGPFPGVLALAVGSVGTVGKLYAEAIEAIDPGPVLAVRATGATPMQIFRYAVLPQALPNVASYSLYLFEHNVRAASVLGVVGAGGIGFLVAKYLALFQYHEMLGAMMLLIVAVTAIDRLSDHLRHRLI
jgi:phosphonate transport system permease protein